MNVKNLVCDDSVKPCRRVGLYFLFLGFGFLTLMSALGNGGVASILRSRRSNLVFSTMMGSLFMSSISDFIQEQFLNLFQMSMRYLLIILVATLLLGQSRANAQSPKQHAPNKQKTQSQVDHSPAEQNSSDTGKTSETQFYTYNNQNPEGNETVKNITDGLLVVFTFALGVVGYL